MTPRERGRSLNCNFDSARLGRTRSGTWFSFLIPELKADRQNAKIKNTVWPKMTFREILGSKPLGEYCYFTSS